MEISKASHTDTRMVVDGSSLNTLMDFTVEEKLEKIETKEWVSNQDELCQDDMFSLAELSAVEDQPEQVVVETTVCTETVTETGKPNVNIIENSVEGGADGFMLFNDYGAAVEINNRADQVSTEEFLQLKLEKNDDQLTNEVSVEINASNEELLESGLVVHDSNNSLASLEEKDLNNYATVTEEIVQRGEHGTKHAENVIDVQIDAKNATDVSTDGGEHDEKIENPPNMPTEDRDATEHGIQKIKKLPNMPTEASDAFHFSTGDKDRKEPVQSNQFILDNSQNVENASTTNAESTKEEDQPHLNQPETEQLESFFEQKQPGTAAMKEEEEVSHQGEPGLEALKGMQDHHKQTEMNVASDISTGDKDKKELVQFNQVTSDNSQHVENVSTTLAVSTGLENHSHVNQPGKEQTELIWEQKQPDGPVRKEEKENSHKKQPGLEALNEKKEHICQKQLEMEAMKEEENDSRQYLEEMTKPAQAGGAVDDKSEVNDNKVSTSDGQLPSQLENVLQGMPVYNGTEESQEIEATAPGHLGSDASDPNHPVQELSENMQSENALQNASTLAGLESDPVLLQGGITECNAEPMEHRDVEKSENMQNEFESLKGRKVSKRFKKKKFLGEVIGYDPESRWFKVLYEDGDEEELEKEELDCILLPVGDAKASVSRKRHLSTDDDENKKPNGSGKKSRKLDIDGTPGKSRKGQTVEDQTPLSQQTSEAKKKKSTVARGKSKTLNTSTPKTQARRKKGSSTKKSIEKKGSANSSHRKSKKKPKSPKNQAVGKAIQGSAKQHSSVTKSLNFDSAKKKTPMKLKKLSEDSPRENKITRSGRTVRVPNKSPKARSVATGADDEVEVQKISMAEKSEVHASGRKRKSGLDIQGGLSTVNSKRVKSTQTVNDMKTPTGSSMKSMNIVEDAKLHLSHEQTSDGEVQIQLNEEKAESSVPTGNRRGKSDRGTVLVGRKVKKDFGGQLFGGVVVGYKIFYKVEYDDGDSEELTWKELESILLLDGGYPQNKNEGSPQNKNEEQQSVKSKSKQRKGSKRI